MKKNTMNYAAVLALAELAVKAALDQIRYAQGANGRGILTTKEADERRIASRCVALTMIDDLYYDMANPATAERLRKFARSNELTGGGKAALLALSGFDQLP